jgi:D-alanine-D-alanine ligase
MRKKVALIFGGRSSEHEISLRSIKNVYEALDKAKFEPFLIGISLQGSWYHISDFDTLLKTKALSDNQLPKNAQACSLICRNSQPQFLLLDKNVTFHVDVAFPVLHGTFGEDGTIQGYFKMMNLPFVGCGVLASSIGMDKEVAKRLMSHAGIANAKSVLITNHNPVSYSALVEKLGSPFFVKPANSGSSVGVYKIKTAADYDAKLPLALSYDSKVLAEEFIEGREIECSVMGLNDSPKSSLPGEIIAQHEFYSYDAKYLDDDGAKIQIPAELTSEQIEKVRALAIKTYQVLGCDGLTRVDFFLKKNGDLFVNEINTIPGFTNISMYPKMWEATGIKYADLITELIGFAVKKSEVENKIQFSLEALNSN